MERNGTTRPGNAPRDVWYQCAGNLVPAYLQPVQLVPTQFPIPPIVVPQHLARNPADPRLLDETTSSQFRGLINNRGDCVALQSQYFARRHKNHDLSLDPEHRPDENFPADDPARQKMLVGQIFLAIRKKTGLLNGQAVRDDQGEPSLDPSGNILRQPDANTRRVDGMSDVKVEMLSWDILVSIIPQQAQWADLDLTPMSSPSTPSRTRMRVAYTVQSGLGPTASITSITRHSRSGSTGS